MRYLPAILGILLCLGCGEKDEAKVTQPVTTVQPAIGRQVPLEQYGRSTISIKGIEIEVYVADEDSERAEGLMFVKAGELKENEGMVFIFPTTAPLSFWMKNTMIALDIAYADDSGKILNIRQMQPLDTSPQPSDGAARYAVEMNEGWFEKNKVKAGDVFDFSNISE